MLIMISCRHASELMSQQLDRPLKLGEKLRLQAHLMICKACPKTLQQFEILREAGKQFANRAASREDKETVLSADSKQRILKKLQTQQSEEDTDRSE
jgi:hypothetical protein